MSSNYHPDHDAPEVVPHRNDGIYIPNDSQGPEVVKQTGPGYLRLPAHDHDDFRPEKRSLSTAEQIPSGAPTRKSRKWLWVGAVALLVVVAVGLGAGLGVTLGKSSNKDKSSSGGGSAADDTTPSTSNSVASNDTKPVISGTTGLAEFSCASSTVIRSTNSVAYVAECYVQYVPGSKSYYDPNTTIANLSGKNTVYTLEACLDLCDKFREDGQEPCRAVTYYANLDFAIDKWGGNCFLKNGRGNAGYRQDEVDSGHTMSAYRRCLSRNGCKGQAQG